MNQSKFSLADVLTLLTALAFGFVCFLGANFYMLGETNQSIILAVIIAVSLSGTALGAKILKRTSRNFKTCFISEMILLVLFTILTLFFAYSPFPHYFVVSGQKTEIQRKLTSNITQAENMFAEYESYAENRENLYERKLRSVANAKHVNSSDFSYYGFQDIGASIEKQIDHKMITAHADLFPTHYSDTINNNGIKEVATTWLSDAKNKISGWKPIGIVGVVKAVEKNSNGWLNTLIGFSIVREKGFETTTKDFIKDPAFVFDDVKKHFTTLGRPTSLSIGLAVVAYFMMLLPWFATQLHSKNPGRRKMILMIFSTSKSTINEL